VFHNCPTLQQRFVASFLRQDDAICALPHWHFTDVADEDIALAASGGGNRHPAQIAGARRAYEIQIASNFITEIALRQAHRYCRASSKFLISPVSVITEKTVT